MKKSSIVFRVLIVFFSLILMVILGSRYSSHKVILDNEEKLNNILSSCVNIFDSELTNDKDVAKVTEGFANTYYAVYYENNLYKVADSFSREIYTNSTLQNDLTKYYVTDYYKTHVFETKYGNYYYKNKEDGQYIIQVITYIPNGTLRQDEVLIYGAGLTILMTLLTLMVSFYLYNRDKKMFMPLISELNKVTKHTLIIEEPFYTLKEEVDSIQGIISNKIKELLRERDKFKTIINTLPEGIVVINRDKKVELVNDFACRIFDYSQNYIVEKEYYYIIRNIDIQNKIELVFKYGQRIEYILDENSGVYRFTFDPTNYAWLENNQIHGVIINIIDITAERNAEKAKENFFSNASHELKSPLTSIIGFQEMISCGILESADEIKDATDKTIAEAKRMNKIIIDMLELSKLDDSSFEAKTENIDFTEIIETSISNMIPRASKKEISISKKLDSKIELSLTKEYAFEIINNLLDNAIKYNVSGGNVEVVLNKYFLSVTDTGLGISRKDQSNVFERFFRVDKNKSREAGGTGLGLAIVKHICDISGFKIELTSRVGKGSTFKIIF